MTNDLASGLAGYWPLDEGSGPIAHDSSTNKNNGTLNNNPVWAKGEIGKALIFNGTNGFDVPNSSSLSGMNALTITFWVKASSGNPASPVLLTKRVSKAPWISYSVSLYSADNHIGATICSAGGTCSAYQATANGSVMNDQWVHYAVVYDGASVTSYINGQQNGNSAPLTGAVIVSDGPFKIADGPSGPVAAMDDIRVYSKALSASDIRYLFNSTSISLGSVSGDVSDNGTVTMYDAGLALRDLLVGGTCSTLTAQQCANAQMDGQGNGTTIDGADVVDIAKRVVGLN